jgi:hypothetical protein
MVPKLWRGWWRREGLVHGLYRKLHGLNQKFLVIQTLGKADMKKYVMLPEKENSAIFCGKKRQKIPPLCMIKYNLQNKFNTISSNCILLIVTRNLFCMRFR